MPQDDRMTRGPPAPSSGECSPGRFRSSRDPALGCRRKGAHLHNTSRGRRAASCPIERCVKRGKFQDYESRQLLLGVGEGAILYAPLSFLKSHRSPCLRHFKWVAADVDAGLDESLVVRPPGAEVGIGFVAIPCRKSFW